MRTNALSQRIWAAAGVAQVEQILQYEADLLAHYRPAERMWERTHDDRWWWSVARVIWLANCRSNIIISARDEALIEALHECAAGIVQQVAVAWPGEFATILAYETANRLACHRGVPYQPQHVEAPV